MSRRKNNQIKRFGGFETPLPASPRERDFFVNYPRPERFSRNASVFYPDNRERPG